MTGSKSVPSDELPVMLISEQKFADVVRSYSDDPAHTDGVQGDPVFPFDDPLFDFIVTCQSDEAAYETVPEIARAYAGIDIPERRALEQMTATLDPRARGQAECYMSHWGYGSGLAETVRALLDLVCSRVSRGVCPAPLGMCCIAYQAGLSPDLQPFLDSWRAWKYANPQRRAMIENDFKNMLLARESAPTRHPGRQ